MIAPRPWFACLVAVLLLAPVCSAGDNGLSRVELGRRGKAATALVEIKNTAVYASAFCIHSSGLFLTNEHVLHGQVMFPNNTQAPDSVTLVLNPGLNTERSYRADVVRKDAIQDLALLRIKGVSGLAALPLGDDDKLEELADVVAFGFPFGNAPLLRNRDYPEISVNAGSITSLRHKNGRLHRIQLDAALNPGNSGGPVLDKTGQVVGVVVATVNPGNGVHFAIPVSVVKRFLARPDVHFEAPEIRSIELYRPIHFEAQVVSILPTEKRFTVDLILQTPRGRPTTHRMKPAGGRYQVTATPMTQPSTPLVVRVVANFRNGVLNATLADRSIHVAGKPLHLSEVRSIAFDSGPTVTLQNGKTIGGDVSGLTGLPIQLGDQTVAVDLSRARQVRFAPEIDVAQLWCTLVVRQGGQEISRQSEPVIVEGALPGPPAGARGSEVRAPTLEGRKVVRRLPAEVDDVAIGGGGRYLLLHLRRLHQIAIFDVNTADIVGKIPMSDEDGKFAAGMEHLVIVLPQSDTIERWNLRTRQHEATATLSVGGPIQAIAMGSASEGPVLVQWLKGTNQFKNPAFALVNLDTLKVGQRDFDKGEIFHFIAASRDHVHLRAAANGRCFGMWCTSHQPTGLATIVVSDLGARAYYAHATVGYVVPGADGKAVFTRNGKYAPEVRLVFNPRPSAAVLPACQGNAYLVLPQPENNRLGVRFNPRRPMNPTPKPVSLPTIRIPGRDKPLAIVTDLDLTVPQEDALTTDLTFDKRVHLIPDARLIITIPTTNDRLILYRYAE